MGNGESKNERQRSADNREARNKELEEQERDRFRWGPGSQPKIDLTVSKKCEDLRKIFQSHLKTPKGRHTFLLFGPSMHGKSSVGNGCMAAVEDLNEPPTYHFVAKSDDSVTGGFCMKKYELHRIMDMPGIFESSKITDENIEKIVTGRFPWVAKISIKTLGIKPDQPKTYRFSSSVECIILVLRYDLELSTELKRQIGVILRQCGRGVLSCHLVLTHLDVCDPQFKNTENLPKLYDSENVQNAVDRMSKETGIPAYSISFVKNYTAETETDHNSKLQFLQMLDKVKKSADQVVEVRTTMGTLAEEIRNQNESFLERYLTCREFLYFIGVLFIAIMIVYFKKL